MRMRLRYLAWVGCLLLILPLSPSWAKDKTARPVTVQSDELVSEITFQAGTIFLCLAETPVHTGHNQLNDPVEARLVHDVYVGERVVIRAASRFWGRITVLDPPIEGRDAILGIRLDRLELPNGEQRAIQGYVDTGSGSRTWGGGLREGTVPRSVQFRVMGLGEYAKTVMTGPRLMGRHYKVDPGEYWRIVLESPLTVPVVNRQRYSP